MAIKINNNKVVAFTILLGAALFNLSHWPDLEVTKVESVDLASLNDCDIKKQLMENGRATCEVGRGKARNNIEIEKLPPPSLSESTPHNPAEKPRARNSEEYQVTVTGDPSSEAAICPNGVCERTEKASSVEKAIALAGKLLEQQQTSVKKEKERLAKIERCDIDEDGEPITNEEKILKCRIERLKDMDKEAAADYYAAHLKERIQDLIQSESHYDRALGMGALAEIGQRLNIKCPVRPNGLFLSQQSLLNQQMASNPMAVPMRPSGLFGLSTKTERNFIAESSCDMWAFGNYRKSIEYQQQLSLKFPHQSSIFENRQRKLHASWGTYFNDRGLVLREDPLGLSGRNQDLLSDLDENNKRLDRKLQAIVDKHQDLLGGQEPVATAQDVSATTSAGGRLGRGGGIQPSNPAAAGGTAGAASGGRSQMLPWPSSTAPNNKPFAGAPPLGAPVGPR